MNLHIKPGAFDDYFRDETFRDDFTYRNSPEGILRFPFPFDRDDYMYSVNMEPHVAGRKGSVFEHAFDIDEHYVSEMRDRAKVLAEDPLRCQSLPHMTLAGWDLLELIMETKARDYPQWFSLTKNGNQWHWVNRPLGINRPCLTARLNISPARRKAILPYKTNATTTFGWMPV
jgi:dimethylamine monooxygenase subunit A